MALVPIPSSKQYRPCRWARLYVYIYKCGCHFEVEVDLFPKIWMITTCYLLLFIYLQLSQYLDSRSVISNNRNRLVEIILPCELLL